MNSLFINETALHTRLLRPPSPSLLQAGSGGRGGGCPFLPPPWRSQALVSQALLGTSLPRWYQRPVRERGPGADQNEPAAGKENQF